MKRLTPLKAVKKFCRECAGSHKEVGLCTANPVDIQKAKDEGDATEYQGCPLYEYRFGKNPARKGLGGFGSSILGTKTPTQHSSKPKRMTG